MYKVDVAGKTASAPAEPLQVAKAAKAISQARRQLSPQLQSIRWKAWEASHQTYQEDKLAGKPGVRRQQGGKKKPGKVKLPLEWWLKLDSVKPLLGKMDLRPDRYVITLDRHTAKEAGQLKRQFGKQTRIITWALPPVMLDRELARMKKHITMLIRTGFRCFQLGHLSQIGLFEGEKVFLSADHSLNLLNNQALLLAAEAGFEAAQLAIEADRESLQEVIQGYKQTGVPATKKSGGRRTMRLGMTVFGAPPLFTARMAAPFFQYGKPVISPKKEGFVISKKDGYTQTRPQKPFSLLPYLHDLKALGLDYAVVDLTGGHSGKKEMQELVDRLSGTGRQPKLPTFNYLGKLE